MDLTYKKRPGTSGISGQLYETKLISLLYFRLLHDNNVEDFYLATNIDEIGAFDDICIKIHIKGHKKPLLLFLQVKHKDNDEKCLSLDNQNDLLKWSKSVLKIKRKFGSGKSCDSIFNCKLSDAECMFILYTNAKYGDDCNIKFSSSITGHLNNLLVTGGTVGCKPHYTERDVHNLSESVLRDEIKNLVEHFVKYLNDKTNESMNIMNDEYILKYNVILAKEIVKVSEAQFDEKIPELKWRTLTFRPEFFDSNDKNLILFKTHLYEKISYITGKVKDKGLTDAKEMPVLKDTDQNTTGIYQSEFKKTPQQIRSEMISNDFITRNMLMSLKLRVPVTFGNIDLTVRGNANKVEKRLNHLTDVLVRLCNDSKRSDSYKIVTIDDTLDEGLLSTNGGLGGIVGNVLEFEESIQMLKFSNPESGLSLPNNARSLYLKLKNYIDDMYEYRFVIYTSKFPRLSFQYADVSRQFFKDLVVYSKQCNHNEIEDMLKKEMEVNNNVDRYNIVNIDSVFLYYHNEIQKWWMSSNTGKYLTKDTNIFQQSLNNIVTEPQLSGLRNMFYVSKVRNRVYTFTESTLNSLCPVNNIPRSIIVADITTLTTMKVIQYLVNKSTKYVILDIECVINMAADDFIALNEELKSTKKIVLIVYDNVQSSKHLHHRLNELANSTKEKPIIIITNDKTIERVKEHFPCLKSNVINDKLHLFDLTKESQQDIINNAQVIFQGQNLGLNLLLDDTSVKFINGTVLGKILRNETLTIGDTLTNTDYENIKDLYIERRVNKSSDPYDVFLELDYEVKSLYDISDDTVLMTAKPGMGKSSLLTHLSVKTKEIDSTVWIVRINFLEHSREFYKWQNNNMVFNVFTTLEFIYRAMKRDHNLQMRLKETNNIVHLEDCIDDDLTNFELNLFLHYYNMRKIIFLFDGFDEICPHYKDNVVKFLNVVRNYPKKNKMWVTSRPYSDILPELKEVLKNSYELDYLNYTEQEMYLKKIWQTKLLFENLNDLQIRNALFFIDFIDSIDIRNVYDNAALNFRFFRICLLFYIYIISYFPRIKIINIQFYKHITHPHFSYSSEPGVNIRSSQSNLSHLESDALLGIPLLLHLLAKYFINILVNDSFNGSAFNINLHSIYSMFIESKLKTILFQDKNKMDVYNPNIMIKYEKERKECLDMHKKVAAYVLLGSPVFSVLNFNEFKMMDPLIDDGLKAYEDMICTIKKGTEKTGLISHVTAENVPVFIHRTFTEFFAAEFLCDILISSKIDFNYKKLLYATINICNKNDLALWIKSRKEMDEELHCIIMQIEESIPLLTCKHFERFRQRIINSRFLTLEQNIRLLNSGPSDFENDFFERVVTNLESLNYIDIKFYIGGMKPHLKKYFTMSTYARIKKFLNENWKI